MTAFQTGGTCHLLLLTPSLRRIVGATGDEPAICDTMPTAGDAVAGPDGVTGRHRVDRAQDRLEGRVSPTSAMPSGESVLAVHSCVARRTGCPSEPTRTPSIRARKPQPVRPCMR